MPVPFEQIRALLLQARNTPDMESQEQECFVERTRLDRLQFTNLNLAHSSVTSLNLDDYDVVFIGGAGEYSAAGNFWLSINGSKIKIEVPLSQDL